jgi:hypothetical protein
MGRHKRIITSIRCKTCNSQMLFDGINAGCTAKVICPRCDNLELVGPGDPDYPAELVKEHGFNCSECSSNLSSCQGAQILFTKLVIPVYELPVNRFLKGIGELKVGNAAGPSTTIWELLIHLEDDKYPICIESEIFTKEDLLFQAAEYLEDKESMALSSVGEAGINQIREMCNAAALPPDILDEFNKLMGKRKRNSG